MESSKFFGFMKNNFYTETLTLCGCYKVVVVIHQFRENEALLQGEINVW